MHTCGYRDLARLLADTHALSASASHRSVEDDAPSFSLPGDKPFYAPDRPADVRHVDIDVTLDFERKSLRGVVTTHFTALFESVRQVSYDAAELSIERITMTGSDTPLSFWSEGEKLFVRLDRAYSFGEQFAVTISYSATPRTGLVFVTPTEGNPDFPVQAWTQGETEYHHFWFPCHDFPNDRATTALSATVPGNFFALSNGRLDNVRENGDGTKTYAWRCDQPFPAYLVTLVAGEFSEIQDHWRETPVNYYVRHGREDDGRRMLGNTPRMMELYSQRFGVDYPFVKYAQIVPEMFLGAMENVSATTHSYRLLPDPRASLDWTPEPVVAHELVHQWYGDMLAIRDWSSAWLKESFATYFEAYWTEHDRGEDEFRAELRSNLKNYLAADERGRRPIVYNVYHKNGFELYDPHIYEKGSLVLHMLRNILGEDAFWRGLQAYTRRNQWREVITADFERALEETTGRSLARFFEQWVYKAGHPEFKVSYSWDDERKLAKLTVNQTQKIDEKTPLFVTPVDIAFMVPTTDEARAADANVQTDLVTFRVTVDEASQTFYFPLTRRPFSVRFDQGGWLIKTLEFDRPVELLRFQLRHDPDVLGRIEAAEALGKAADPQSVAALEEALIAEQFWAVRAAIAEAIGSQRNVRALDTLLHALETIDEPKARRAIVAALGEFRAPAQPELADRAAQVLTRIVRDGDPSYFVEATAATSLGKTRTTGAYETLVAKTDTPSWNETIRGGVFMGLAELGDPRAVEVLTSWLRDPRKPMDARAAAANGLRALADTKEIDPGAAQTKVVDALIGALGDPWELVEAGAVRALGSWGDARAIPALQRVIASSADERFARGARQAILHIQRGHKASDEAKTLRKDLDELRDENRRLRDRVQALEAQAHGGDRADA